jgi:hypothetical protein
MVGAGDGTQAAPGSLVALGPFSPRSFGIMPQHQGKRNALFMEIFTARLRALQHVIRAEKFHLCINCIAAAF